MRTFGLIGNPLTHSFSAEFFNRKFQQEKIEATYLNFELPDIGDLMELVAEIPDLCGFNVTIPYKELVIPYLDDISSEARAIGAVNVVKINRKADGSVSLIGYNSDAPAFARSIASMLPDSVSPLEALVLGSGGASKAVCHALRSLAIEPVVVSRNPEAGQLSYADLSTEVMASHTIVVNATPLGTFPNVEACPDIPYGMLTSRHVCMDLTYNPAETLFMRKSAMQGARTKNGADMLTLQALLSWQIWNKT